MNTHRMLLANAVAGAGMPAAVALLAAGAPGLDAIEAGIRLVELDLAVDSVGVGGLPNLRGAVELDASIMDGRTRRCGAVGALIGYPHAISVARQVMERLPHVLLVGEGAAQFAQECGATASETLMPEAARKFHAWLAEARASGISTDSRIALARHSAGAEGPQSRPERTGGTTTFLARDAHGNCASGVSTSGWAYKYPGRLGDSPIIGAGNYADNRSGMAACTGQGELTIRAGTARAVVLAMKLGLSVRDACYAAADDLRALQRDFGGNVTIHAVSAAGESCVLGIGDGASAGYWYWDDTLNSPEERAADRIDW